MAKFSLDTKLKDIMNDPEAKAVLISYLPEMADNPQLKMAFSMKLSKVLSFPQVPLTKEQIAEIDQKLQALG